MNSHTHIQLCLFLSHTHTHIQLCLFSLSLTHTHTHTFSCVSFSLTHTHTHTQMSKTDFLAHFTVCSINGFSCVCSHLDKGLCKCYIRHVLCLVIRSKIHKMEHLYAHMEGYNPQMLTHLLSLRPFKIYMSLFLYQIWRNVALHHLFSNGCSAVNGCRQNESPNG